MSDVLKGLDEKKTDAEKVEFLRSVGPRYVDTLRILLKHAFDPNIKFALPEGAPPFTTKEDDAGSLIFGAKKLYLYVEGGYPNLTQMRREQLFSNFLESMPTSDANLLIAVKDKKFPGVNKKLALKAFPSLF